MARVKAHVGLDMKGEGVSSFVGSPSSVEGVVVEGPGSAASPHRKCGHQNFEAAKRVQASSVENASHRTLLVVVVVVVVVPVVVVVEGKAT